MKAEATKRLCEAPDDNRKGRGAHGCRTVELHTELHRLGLTPSRAPLEHTAGGEDLADGRVVGHGADAEDHGADLVASIEGIPERVQKSRGGWPTSAVCHLSRAA